MWTDKAKHRQYISERRRRYKRQLIQVKGGKCELCGYSKCEGALEFHHLDEKEGNISRIYNRGWKRVLAEAEKTRLLCANCHREQHAGESLSTRKMAAFPTASEPDGHL